MLFQGISGIFAVFENFYLFIPQFLAEPLTLFSGTLVTKLWSKLKEEPYGVSASHHGLSIYHVTLLQYRICSVEFDGRTIMNTTNQQTNQPTNQTNQLTNQPTNQLTNQPTNQTNQPTNQPNKQTNQATNQQPSH